jgi:hypothetical protein
VRCSAISLIGEGEGWTSWGRGEVKYTEIYEKVPRQLFHCEKVQQSSELKKKFFDNSLFNICMIKL